MVGGESSSIEIRHSRAGLISFLLIAFGISWALWIPIWLLGMPPSEPLPQLMLIIGAFSPAIAAIVVRAAITREGFMDAGLMPNLRDKLGYYMFAWLWPFFAIAVVAIVLEAGDFGNANAIGRLASIPVLDYIALLISGLVYIPLFWGEEFGWRGYLQIRLFGNSSLAAAIAVGLIWGVWHFPAVLAGLLPNEHGLMGLALFPLYTVLFSIILGWLRNRSQSVWPAVLAHSANNMILATLGAVLGFAGNHGELLFTAQGTILIGVMGAICLCIILSDYLGQQFSILNSKQKEVKYGTER